MLYITEIKQGGTAPLPGKEFTGNERRERSSKESRAVPYRNNNNRDCWVMACGGSAWAVSHHKIMLGVSLVMNRSELNIYNKIQQRIDLLEEELYALFEAQGIRINPVKRIIKVLARTKQKDHSHDVAIELTLEDIRLLQDARMKEVKFLKGLLGED